MNKTTVVWKPAWYELDQSLSVGETNCFYIIKSAGLIRFATGLDEISEKIQGKTLSITNSEPGNILRIDAAGLSYKFYTDKIDCIQIDAEEHPGLIEKADVALTNLIDAVFYVELEIL